MEKRLKKIYTLFIVLMPILNIYATEMVHSLGIGELLGGILLVVLCFVGYRDKILLRNVPYWFFILYLIFNSLVFTLLIPKYLISETIIRIFKTLFYTSIIFIFSQYYLDLQFLKKIYLGITFIASTYLLLQYLSYLLFNINLPVVLPNMTLLNSMSSEEFRIRLLRSYAYEYRPSGFFMEPAHFCQYVVYSIPMIFMQSKKETWHYIVLIVTGIAILISGSAIGYACFACTIGLWIIFSKNKKRFLVFVLAILFVLVSIQYGFWDKALGRVLTVNKIGASTGTVRLLRGLIVFEKMPWVFKVFGMGAGNYSAFINTFNIHTMFDSVLGRENEYMNTFSMILVYGGIVGSGLYIWALYRVIRNVDKLQFMFLVIFLLIISTGNIFYTASYIMPMILLHYKMEENPNFV